MSRKPESETRGLLLLCIVHLGAWLPFSAYVVGAPLIQAEFGLTAVGAGGIFSMYLVGYAIGSLVVVPLTDRWPTEWVILTGLACLAAGHLLFVIGARDLISASILRFGLGVAQVSVYVPGVRLVAEWAGVERAGTSVGWFVSTAYAGSTGSYLLGGWLIELLGAWRPMYLTLVAPAVLAAIAAIPLLRGPRFRATSERSFGSARPVLPDFGLLRRPELASVIGAYALHTAELYLARLWLPATLAVALQATGLEALEAVGRASVLAGVAFMLGIPAVAWGGRASDRHGRTLVGAAVFSGSAAFALVIAAAPILPLAILVAAGAAYGALTAADSAVYSTAVIELAPSGDVGAAQALQSFIGFSAGAAAPVIAGFFVASGSGPWAWSGPFVFSAVIALIGLAAMARLHFTTRPALTPRP